MIVLISTLKTGETEKNVLCVEPQKLLRLGSVVQVITDLETRFPTFTVHNLSG